MRLGRWRIGWQVAALAVVLLTACPAHATPECLGDAPGAWGDDAAVRLARGAIAALCPCASYDGSAGHDRRAFKSCAKTVLAGLVDAGNLRAACRGKVRRMTWKSTCGYPRSQVVVCVREQLATGAVGCGIETPVSACRGTPLVDSAVRCSKFTNCLDAADTNDDLRIAAPGDTGACNEPSPTPSPRPTAAPTPAPTGADGKRLAELINAYRAANGKPAHPLSRTMMATASTHVSDLVHYPETDSGVCTPHSWSNHGGLLFTGCCYTVDHAQAACMWEKPRQISAGLGMIQYTGNGYEIALRGYEGNTPEDVVQAFANSAPHRAVMLSTGGWEFLDAHPAMGAAMLGKYSVVWFGDATDPN